MHDADDGGGDGDDDDEDLRLSFLYIQTPDQLPPRPLCYIVNFSMIYCLCSIRRIVLNPGQTWRPDNLKQI